MLLFNLYVKPTALPNYRNQHVPAGHYVIVKGFLLQAGATTQISIQYNDPNWDDKTYGSQILHIALNIEKKR